MVDLSIRTPTTIAVVGPTQCGKTHFVFELFKNPNIFLNPNCVKNIFYFYKAWSSEFDKNKHLIKQFINNNVTSEYIKELSSPFKHNDGCIIVIDDFQEDLNQEIADLFTVFSHHNNITPIIIMQSLYGSNKTAQYQRIIKRNTHHLILFDNHMDKSQFSRLGQLLFPQNKKFFLKAFEDATNKFAKTIIDNMGKQIKTGYLWVAGHPQQNAMTRLRTNVLKNDPTPPIIFTPNTNIF